MKPQMHKTYSKVLIPRRQITKKTNKKCDYKTDHDPGPGDGAGDGDDKLGGYRLLPNLIKA